MPSVENLNQNSNQTYQKYQSPTHVPTSFKWSGWGSNVCVAGSFDPPLPAWTAIEMPKNSEGDNEIVLDLLPGKRYRYKFVIDGTWVTDDLIESYFDEHGNRNHEVQVEFPPSPPLLSEKEKGDEYQQEIKERQDEHVETEQDIKEREDKHVETEHETKEQEDEHVENEQIKEREDEHVETEQETKEREDEHIKNEQEIKEREDEHVETEHETKEREDEHVENEQEIKEREDEHVETEQETKERQDEHVENEQETKEREDEHVETEHETKEREDEHVENEQEIKKREDEHVETEQETKEREDEHVETEQETKEREDEHVETEQETKERQDEHVEAKQETVFEESHLTEKVIAEDQKEQHYQEDQEYHEDQFVNEHYQDEVLNEDQIGAEDKELSQHEENQIEDEDKELHQHEENQIEDEGKELYQHEENQIEDEGKELYQHEGNQIEDEDKELHQHEEEDEGKELYQHVENQVVAGDSDQHQQTLLSNESVSPIPIESPLIETNIEAEETPNESSVNVSINPEVTDNITDEVTFEQSNEETITSYQDEGISSEIINSTIITSTHETTDVESTFNVSKEDEEEVKIPEDIINDNKGPNIGEQVAQGNSEDLINESKFTEFIRGTTDEKDEHNTNISTEKTVVSTDNNYSNETETTTMFENEENNTEYSDEDSNYTQYSEDDEYTESVMPLSEDAVNTIILENTWARYENFDETIPSTWLETDDEPSEFVWREDIHDKLLDTETDETTETTNGGEIPDLGSTLVKHEIIVKETIVEDKTKESGDEIGKEILVAKENIISTSDVKEEVVVEPSSAITAQNEKPEDGKVDEMLSIPSTVTEPSNEHQDEKISKAFEKLKLIKKRDNYEEEAYSIVAGIIPIGKISQPTKKSREISTKTVKPTRKNTNEISRRDSKYVTQENLGKIDFSLVYIITSFTTTFALGIISMIYKSLFGSKKNK